MGIEIAVSYVHTGSRVWIVQADHDADRAFRECGSVSIDASMDIFPFHGTLWTYVSVKTSILGSLSTLVVLYDLAAYDRIIVMRSKDLEAWRGRSSYRK